MPQRNSITTEPWNHPAVLKTLRNFCKLFRRGFPSHLSPTLRTAKPRVSEGGRCQGGLPCRLLLGHEHIPLPRARAYWKIKMLHCQTLKIYLSQVFSEELWVRHVADVSSRTPAFLSCSCTSAPARGPRPQPGDAFPSLPLPPAARGH